MSRGKRLPLDHFRAASGESYTLLPFNFMPFDRDRYLITNLVGEHLLLPRPQLAAFVRKELPPESPIYCELKTRHFLLDCTSRVALDLLAAKYRTKLSPVSNFTGLHIFIATLRCNNRCVYCQASSREPDRPRLDMSIETADKAVDFMFRSPSPQLKVEFQGGEPLLNFPVLRHIVEEAEARNRTHRRSVEFVVCTNLTILTEEMVRFFGEHDIYVSTSLDGPEDLHNANRPAPSGNSYQSTVANITRLQQAIGPHRISALMTTTRASLRMPQRIIDEYLRHGFTSLFLRVLNPYGRADGPDTYNVDEWLDFYERALEYIIAVNRAGVPFREELSAIVLRKILTPHGTGFVDLQSPAGTGISVMVYNYDGKVYPSDEARMLAEMGDRQFVLGDLYQDTYEDIVFSDKLLGMIRDTMLEGVPQCSDCALRVYCGADPVRHYRVQGDPIGHKPSSEFCRKMTFVVKHLIRRLEDDTTARAIFEGWL